MKKYIPGQSKPLLLIIASIIFIVSVVNAQQRQISLTGFNADVIADSGLNQTDPTLITSLPIDPFPGDVLFAQGYSNNATPYANGLPGNGQIISPSGNNFELVPYNASNDLRLAQFDFGTMVFSIPDRISYDSLLVLAAATGGAAKVNYLLLFTDNSSAAGTVLMSDWTCIGCTNYAINNLSKIDRTTGAVSGTNQYALSGYAIYVPIAYKSKQVYGLLFSVDTAEASVANIFAVTGFPATAAPVTLVYYNAKANNGSAVLQWKTAQELNNKNYVIERAGIAAPNVFEQVGTVAATTGAANGSVYSFSDAPENPGTYFYKLVQADVDGKKTVLGIRSVTIEARSWTVQDLGSQWRLISSEAFTYRLTDMNGAVLKAGIEGAGTTIIAKPSASGIYILQVLLHGKSSTQKLLK
jgi:hypothetical protein